MTAELEGIPMADDEANSRSRPGHLLRLAPQMLSSDLEANAEVASKQRDASAIIALSSRLVTAWVLVIAITATAIAMAKTVS